MRRLIVNDLLDVVDVLYTDIVNSGFETSMFVGKHEDIVFVLKYLLMLDEPMPYHIDIEFAEWDGYDKEYYLVLDSEMNIWCEKAYDYKNNRYIGTEADCIYMADDCNSALLEHIDCLEEELYEVSYDLEDDECDGNCACCGLAKSEEKENKEKETNKENKKEKSKDDTHTEITRVATDDNGKLRGFEKSWETHEDGLHYHSTYSFYSSNENVLKNMMENFSIKY